MPALKDVKNKINGVTKTKQITKAMNMVASAKLRNAQARIERFRPYADKFYEMLGELAKGADPSVHPLLEAREEVKTVLLVVITSDRGLCGSDGRFRLRRTIAAPDTCQKQQESGRRHHQFVRFHHFANFSHLYGQR